MDVQKAKIVDLNSDYAVVLTDSGAFKRIARKGNMSVGGGIYITDHDLYMNTSASGSFKLPLFSKRLLQVTGVMALLIMILVTQSFAPMSYAVISVDINPSIQLFIDADYNVIKIESMNADGEKLLSAYDFIKKTSASSVLTELFTLATEMDYLKSDQNEILIAAAIYKPSKNDKNMKMGSDVDNLIDAVLNEVDYSIFEEENVVISSVTSNAKNIEAAEKEHLTIGQYEKDRHSDTVKPYAIVEDGKKIKTNKKPDENTDTPIDTSNEEKDEEVNDNNRNGNDGNHLNEKDKDKNKNKDDDKVNQETTNSDNTNNYNNNSNNNTTNGNNSNKSKNNNKNTSGNIDNIKHNVENSSFAGNKNRKSFDGDKVDDLNDSELDQESDSDGDIDSEKDKGSDKDNSKPKNNH